MWRALPRIGADTRRLIEEIPDPRPPEITQYNRHHYER